MARSPAASPSAEPEAHPTSSGDSWTLARFGLLRLVGLSGCCAFLSLWNQVEALLGRRGLTPAAETMALYGRFLDLGSRWRAPTLFWLSADDGFLRALVGVGLVASVLLAVGVWPRAMCAVLYASFLSFNCTDRIMGAIDWRWFNWPADHLLLECAALGTFLAPRGWFPGLAHDQPVGRTVRYLFYWLAFRLYFGPGMAKLLSTDPDWRELSALRPFYLMLPSPTRAAPDLYDAPLWVHRVTTLATLAFELVGTLLFAVPGWPRRVAALGGIGMMAGIHLSGNYRWLLLLSVGLLLLLLDDRWLLRWLPNRWWTALRAPVVPRSPGPVWWSRLGLVAALAVAAGGAVSLSYPCRLNLGKVPGLRPIAEVVGAFGLGSGFAMFAGMPHDRPGLVVQGSDDGETWQDYETLGGPSNARSVPRRVEPYSDYLSFAMWSCSRVPPEQAPSWLTVLQQRLLEGDPVCRSLFAADPFPERPPKEVRVARYSFRYASAEERRDGIWWQREWRDLFVPARSLAAFDPTAR